MNQYQKFGRDIELDLCLKINFYKTSFEFIIALFLNGSLSVINSNNNSSNNNYYYYFQISCFRSPWGTDA